MPSYKAPVADYEFLLFDVLQIDKNKDLPGYAELDQDTVHAVLEGAGTFMSEVLQPLNQSGDEEGCQPTRHSAKPDGTGWRCRKSLAVRACRSC